MKIVVYTHISSASLANEDQKIQIFLQPKERMLEWRGSRNMTG